MKTKILYSLTAIFFLISIFFAIKEIYLEHAQNEPVYIKYSRAITNQYIKDMNKKYDLFYFGGGGGFLYNVENIAISFSCNRNITLEDGRSLLISCSKELLKRINRDERIRPYLDHYPYTEKGIDIDICFFDVNGRWVIDPDSIAKVASLEGAVHYAIFDKNHQCLNTIYRESYKDSENIVESNRWNFLSYACLTNEFNLIYP